MYPDGLRDYQPWRGWQSGPLGTFTDDTQLTVVVAEWLVDAGAGPLSADELGDRVAEWGVTGRGIGAATREALWNYERGLPWWRAGVESAGNGGAMRAAPYGLRFAGLPDDLRHAAALGTAPTHADVTAVASAIVQAAAVNQCLVAPGQLDSSRFLDALVESVSGFELPELAHRSGQGRFSLTQRIEEVADWIGRPSYEVFDHFFNGAFVLETTPVVLWCLLELQDDPEEALVTAVMGGRDADTVAAMVGNLLGALHGLDVFPERWTGAHLEDHDRLIELADALYETRWAEQPS
jgi:ADP-ribosylglycohydrolase